MWRGYELVVEEGRGRFPSVETDRAGLKGKGMGICWFRRVDL